MEDDKKPERPTSSHSSDKDGVSGPRDSAQQASRRPSAPTDERAPLQDSFEDASEITPRPESHTERSQSRSRSLISKRASTDTTVQEPKADSPVPDAVAAVATADTNGDAEQPKGADVGEVEATEAPVEDVPPAKSPLLTAHRISVTSDMDDVSLEEGARDCCPPGLNPAYLMQKARKTRICYPSCHHEIRETRRPRQAHCKACPVRCRPSSFLHLRLRLPSRKSRPRQPQYRESSQVHSHGSHETARARSPDPRLSLLRIAATPMHPCSRLVATPSSS
jgi:hypothetical protein